MLHNDFLLSFEVLPQQTKNQLVLATNTTTCFRGEPQRLPAVAKILLPHPGWKICRSIYDGETRELGPQNRAQVVISSSGLPWLKPASAIGKDQLCDQLLKNPRDSSHAIRLLLISSFHEVGQSQKWTFLQVCPFICALCGLTLYPVCVLLRSCFPDMWLACSAALSPKRRDLACRDGNGRFQYHAIVIFMQACNSGRFGQTSGSCRKSRWTGKNSPRAPFRACRIRLPAEFWSGTRRLTLGGNSNNGKGHFLLHT